MGKEGDLSDTTRVGRRPETGQNEAPSGNLAFNSFNFNSRAERVEKKQVILSPAK